MKTEDEYALDLFKGASQLGRDTVAAAKALPSEVVGLADGVVQATATVAANALESFNKAVGGIIGVFQQKMQNDAQ